MYQFGMFIEYRKFGAGTVAAAAVLVFMLYMLFRKNKYEVK